MVKRFEVEVIEAPRAPWMGWTLAILGILFVVAVAGVIVFGGGDAEGPSGPDECPADCPTEPVVFLGVPGPAPSSGPALGPRARTGAARVGAVYVS